MIRTLVSLLPDDSRGKVAAHLALTVLGVLLRAAGAVVLVPLVAALFSPDPGTAWPWLGVLALVTCAGWAVDTTAARLGFALGFGLLDSGQRAIADRITAIRLSWFGAEAEGEDGGQGDGAGSGSGSDNTAEARQAVAATGPELVGLVVYLVAPLIGAVLLPGAIAVALLPVSVPLGCAALLGVPVLLGAFWAAGRLGRDADREASAANSRLTERILEFARTQQALRAARRVAPERSHAGAALAAQHGASMRLLLLQVPGELLFGVASQLALLLLAGTTVALTADGQLGAAEAIALIVVIVRYLEAFAVLAELSPGIESAMGTLRRMRTVLDAPVDPAGSETEVPDGPPRIELRDVVFRYGSGAAPAVLDGFDLDIEPGTTTAIVGPSGSGKSTILALIAGMHQPAAGSVRVGGADVASLDAERRRALVSVVFQHPYLFDGTIRENVLAGDPGADDAALESAARLARIDTLVERLPDGWSARVGEAGATLSGGERQRVSIARALLKPAPVLLVDEATSALDAENEAAVAAALTADPTPRTRIIVAHRLTTIRAADRIVFLDSGRIVQDGPLDTLLAADGPFASFWHHQHAAGAWKISDDSPAREGA